MRVAGWQEVLEREMQAASGRRFRWGSHDCCAWIARVTRAATGIDRRKLFAAYRTRQAAEALLAQHGGMLGLLTHAFGKPVHPSRAGAGDVVMIEMGNGPQPALCMGLHCYAPGRRNLVTKPTLEATAAWTI